jgi:hypothetical protein
VEAAGGYVWWDRVMGELAVSRAIGDHCLRPYVIAVPEVSSPYCCSCEALEGLVRHLRSDRSASFATPAAGR